ncbi:MAG TPA: hypothetical protein PLD84_12735 [Chitinophagales bacterium]|nr:hypothetical protein [Chitinophagales bacterium]
MMIKGQAQMIRSMQMMVIILVMGMSCNTTGNSKNAAVATNNPVSIEGSESGEAGISISTAKAVPLYKQVHSGCTIDIFFGKGMVPRNVLADPYFSWIKALNLYSLQYSGGSTSDHDHAIIGDTLINGGKGDGYNMRREDAQARGESFEGLLDGVGTVKFGVDFFNQYTALVHKLNVRGDIIANVQSGTLEELYWKIERSHAQRVIFGLEQNISSNSRDFPDGSAYRKKIATWIEAVEKKYPGIITVIDAAPIYRQSAKFGTWNKQLEGIPGDEARLYLWDKDLFETKENPADNLPAINEVFSTTIPQWLNNFKSTFPGKKAAVCQWGIKAKSPIHNTMIGCLYLGKFYEFMISYNKANNNFIGYASFMTLKTLNRGENEKADADNFYKILKACGLLFTGNKQVDDMVITGINGVSGISCSENGTYTLLLMNETGSEVKIPSIKINGSSVTGKSFTVNSVAASSLGSYDVNEAVNKVNTLTLKPYSVNVVTF